MKKALVTGGAGFIGSHLVDELVKRDYEVTVFDNLDSQVHSNNRIPNYLNKNAKFIKGDVGNYGTLKEVMRDAEIVFHLAAAVGVSQSQYQIKKYIEVNIDGTANLLDILVNHKNKIEKLVIAASMSSYGEGKYECLSCGMIRPSPRLKEQMENNDWELKCPNCRRKLKPIPTDEESIQNCNSIYALTKKAQEDMALNIGKTYKIPTVALRYFNVYGPRQSLSNPYTGVIAIFMSRIKNNNPTVIYEDGLQTRDFICVHDIVRATILAMEKEEANYEIFNVGTGKALTIKGVAETLARLYGKDIKPIITHKFRKGDIRHCYADISKIKNKLGFTPTISFEKGMQDFVEWARKTKSQDRFDRATEELKAKRLV